MANPGLPTQNCSGSHRLSVPGLLVALGVAAFGCTPGQYVQEADREVYGILEKAAERVTGTAKTFMLERPVDRLRQRLIEGDEEVILEAVGGAGYQVGIQPRTALTITDDEAVVLSLPTLELTAGPMLLGERFQVSLRSENPGALYLLYFSTRRGFLELPSLTYPILLDPLAAVPVASGVLDGSGSGHVATTLNYDPTLLGQRFSFQAYAVNGGPMIHASQRVDRTPLSP